MTAMPPSFPGPLGAEDGARRDTPGDPIARKWTALGEAAEVVSALAGMDSPAQNKSARDFPEAISEAGGWRKDRAENGVDDLAAIMEPGIAALLSVNASGADPGPAARALLEEFSAAREALLALLPPPPHPHAAKRPD